LPSSTDGARMVDIPGSRPPVLFEACVDSVAGALQAVQGGASRLELCEALLEGGVTPSIGKIRKVTEYCKLANPAIVIHVIIRPRSGDFCYTADEIAVMLGDIAAVKAAGADGIVIGVLRPDGSVNAGDTAVLIEAARPMKATFHRAIDVARDAMEAFQVCADLSRNRD
jgi:copper homeostasis protein